MTKPSRVDLYEISVQMRVLDKSVIPQIVTDKEAVTLIAHVAVLRAGESKRGAKRLFGFQKQSILPGASALWYGWVAENDWTLPQEGLQVVAWLPLEALPTKKQAEFTAQVKQSAWGLVAVVLMDHRLRLRDVQVDISMADSAHDAMRAELGLPELINMPELNRPLILTVLEKREIYQVFL